MKRNIFLIAFFIWFISFATGYAGNVVMPSRWLDNPIIIDGSPKDWGEHPVAFFKQANVSMGVANDSNYIYFLLNFKDLPQTKFFQRHIAIWLDKTNKNKKNFGIRYAGNINQPVNLPEQSGNFHPMPEEFSNRLLVINKKDTLILKTTDDKYGYQVATNFEQGFYCHEVKIPIQLNDTLQNIFITELGEKISVGLELGMNPAEFKGMKPKDGERPGMPGNMPPGGTIQDEGMDQGPRMGIGNGPDNRPNNGMQMPEKQEYWIKIMLASNPSLKNENK
jgi:hypothetical protein